MLGLVALDMGSNDFGQQRYLASASRTIEHTSWGSGLLEKIADSIDMISVGEVLEEPCPDPSE